MRALPALFAVPLVLQACVASPAGGAPVTFPAPGLDRLAGLPRCPTLRLDRDAAFFLDEDNFQFAPATDQNYTLGTGFTWGGDEGPDQGSHPLLDAPLDGLEAAGRWSVRRLFGVRLPETPRPQHYARTLFASAFTPEHIERPDIQYGDRPYAFLLAWTVARSPDATHTASPRLSFWRGEATLGVLGSPLGEAVQRSIHAVARTLNGSDQPPDPAGWDHQILDSRFGIPTARYDLSHVAYRRWPMAPEGGRGASLELVRELGAEVGYYTDAHAGWSAAFGWPLSPLWTMNEQPEHPGLVASAESPGRAWEAFVYATVEGYAYAYNALLQGYGDWRSDYRFSRRDIETFTYELREGLVVGTRRADAGSGHVRRFRFVFEPYAFRSREFKGALARGHAWGSVRFAVSESFDLARR